MKFKRLYLILPALAFFLPAALSVWGQNSIDIQYNITMQETRKLFQDMQFDPERYEQAMAVQLDNELQPSEEGKDANFYVHPLLLNNMPLDYAYFSINSRGVLTVVEGNPESPEAEAIPFYIYLRRDGAILTQGASSPAREVTFVDINTVLKLARLDDQLIIEPVRKRDWKAKRILRIVASGGNGC